MTVYNNVLNCRIYQLTYVVEFLFPNPAKHNSDYFLFHLTNRMEITRFLHALTMQCFHTASAGTFQDRNPILRTRGQIS